MNSKIIALGLLTFLLIGCASTENENVGSTNDPTNQLKKYIGNKNQDVKNQMIDVEGTFLFTVGSMGGKKTSFDRDYSDITLQNDQVLIRLKSEDGIILLMTLRGPEVRHMPVRKYSPIHDPNGFGEYKTSLSIMGVREGDFENPNVLKRGEVEITHIDLQQGLIQGYFVQLGGRLKDTNDERLEDFNGKFDVKGLVVQEQL